MNRSLAVVGFVSCVVLLLAGCQSSAPQPGAPAASDTVVAKERELADREAAVERREAELEMERKEDDLARREADLAERERAATPQAPATSSTAAPQGKPVAPPQAPPSPPEPAPEPEPQFVTLVAAAGTQLEVELLDTLSSGTSQTGQRFRGRLVTALSANGRTIAPAGSAVSGVLTEVVSLKKFGGQPSLTGMFDRIEIGGTTHAIHASVAERGKKQSGRDAAKIGGAAAAGAIVGHQVDDDHGKLVGGLVGGAIGTAVAAKTGKEIEVPAGTRLTVALDKPLSVEVPE